MARGLLHRYHRQLHALHELLSAAEGKLSRGVEQLSQDREQLPQRVLGATDRLQSVVDQMQQDAAGAASEKQTLMAEVLQLRHKVNDSIGEARALKAELLDEKKEKQSMAKELIAAQIGANEKATAQQLRLNELEQQNLATSDVLAQLEVREAEGAAKLKAAVEAEEEGARRVRRAEQARLVLSAQNQSLAAEAEEAAEREDALNLQLLNATNAQAKAERELAEAQAVATSSESSARGRRSAPTTRPPTSRRRGRRWGASSPSCRGCASRPRRRSCSSSRICSRCSGRRGVAPSSSCSGCRVSRRT